MRNSSFIRFLYLCLKGGISVSLQDFIPSSVMQSPAFRLVVNRKKERPSSSPPRNDPRLIPKITLTLITRPKLEASKLALGQGPALAAVVAIRIHQTSQTLPVLSAGLTLAHPLLTAQQVPLASAVERARFAVAASTAHERAAAARVLLADRDLVLCAPDRGALLVRGTLVALGETAGRLLGGAGAEVGFLVEGTVGDGAGLVGLVFVAADRGAVVMRGAADAFGLVVVALAAAREADAAGVVCGGLEALAAAVLDTVAGETVAVGVDCAEGAWLEGEGFA